MYFKVDIGEEGLKSTVCDIMEFYGFEETKNSSGYSIALCDEYTVNKYVGVCPSLVLYRSREYTMSSEYSVLVNEADCELISVPFAIDVFMSCVIRLSSKNMTEFDITDRNSAISFVGICESKELGKTTVSARIKVDGIKRTVEYGEKHVELTEREFELFEYMYERTGTVVKRSQIIHDVWKDDTDSGVVNVYMSYLRKKLDSIMNRGTIVSVRNEGYMLKL